MMKRSNPSATIIAALALTIVFGASVFAVHSLAAAKLRIGEPSATRPVRGIDVVVLKEPGNSAARSTKTNADGTFTMSGVEAGTYEIHLQCRTCVWPDPRVDSKDATAAVTIATTSDNNRKTENSHKYTK